MTGIIQDLRHAARGLIRSPGSTTLAVITLALGIGANAAVFSLINALLLKAPSYVEPDRLVLLNEAQAGVHGYSGAISAPNFTDWQQQNTVFEQIAAVTGGAMTLTTPGVEPRYVSGLTVSASYFDLFGVRPALGRTFAPHDAQPGDDRVVVLSHRLWASQFASDPGVVGRSVQLDGNAYSIIGVMPAGFAVDLFGSELWTPRDFAKQGGALTAAQPLRGFHDLNRAVARLKRGVTLDQARTQMQGIAERLARAYPESNKGWGILVEPWPRPVGQDVQPSLYLLFAAVGTVLVLTCINLGNLMLVRTSARAREFAIRVALGADRRGILRPVLIEHFIIISLGGLGGLVLGHLLLESTIPAILSTGTLVPAETTISMDSSVWLFGLVLTTLSGLVVALPPALGAIRHSLVHSLNEHGSTIAGARGEQRFRRGLVVAEVAAAFILLSGAAVLMRSAITLNTRMTLGFDSRNVLTAALPIPEGRFDDARALNAYLDQIADRIGAVPGVSGVAFTEGLPIQGPPYLRSFQITGEPVVDRSLRPYVPFKSVSPSYFHALGLRMLEGRALDETDRAGNPRALVVNATFARSYLIGRRQVGTRILVKSRGRVNEDDLWEVVGVVADEGLSMWTRAPGPMFYASRQQDPSSDMTLVVRGAVESTGFQRAIQHAVAEVSRDQAVTAIQVLTELQSTFMAPDRVRSLLFGIFAAITTTLAAMGLYGVLSRAVVQRSHEIGIRSALGAARWDLLALMVGQGIVMTSYGLGLGLGGAIGVGRLLTKFLLGVEPLGLMTVASVAGLLTAVALLACYFPARRAARVDPLVALRYE